VGFKEMIGRRGMSTLNADRTFDDMEALSIVTVTS